MFLTLLNEGQSVLFARAARLMIEADDIAHERELAMLEAIGIETGLTELPDGGTFGEVVQEAAKALTDPTQRNAFLIELAGVAVIDGDEHGAERALLQQLADQLGLGERVDEFIAYAHDARDLADRGRALVTTVEAD